MLQGTIDAMGGEPEIRLLSAEESSSAPLMARVTELTNEVYAIAEEGLWTAGATRTTVDEIGAFTRAGELAVARLNGEVVGSVRVQRLDERTGEFGMLAADPAYRGLGIGRELVRFAERSSRDAGLRDMQLELLVPEAGRIRARCSSTSGTHGWATA